MITFLGSNALGHTFCDGLSRRSLMQIGALSLGGAALPGLTLPRLLADDATKSNHKSVILVYLSGGMSHQDTFDLKPKAPAEIRGEFNPIATNLPGFEVGELLPKLSQCADKYAIIRATVGLRDEHSSFHNLVGYPMGETQRDGKPNFGSVVSRLLGPTDPVIPPFVDLFPTMQHRPYNSAGAGYLGARYNQVKVDGEDMASMKLRYISNDQFGDRRRLLDRLDAARRELEANSVREFDEQYTRAFDVLTSSKIVDAINLDLEDPKLRDRYGRGSPNHLGDGAPMWNDQLLMARRLVEAGVRVVTVAYGFWDTHGNNFGHLKAHLPLFDTGISALIEDIYERGLDKDVTVCVCGEFGRTPKINKDAGRDHWAPVSYTLFAGGGMNVGQVIGTTDKSAAYAETNAVHFRDVLATIYWNLGIDPHEFFRDATDRPVQALPESAQPIRELVG